MLDGWVDEITYDNDGNTWVKGYADERIIVYKDESWETHNLGSLVQAVAINPQGQLWVGTSFDISILEDDRWTNIPLNIRINVIKFDPMGRAWIGGDIDGLMVVDGSERISFDRDNSMLPGGWTDTSTVEINDIEFDKQGFAWLGTPDGLFVLPLNLPEPVSEERVQQYQVSILTIHNIGWILIPLAVLWGTIYLNNWYELFYSLSINSIIWLYIILDSLRPIFLGFAFLFGISAVLYKYLYEKVIFPGNINKWGYALLGLLGGYLGWQYVFIFYYHSFPMYFQYFRRSR